MPTASILEDNLLILEALRAMVVAAGVDVLYAGRDPDAFEAAVTATPPDLVFVDIKLQDGQNGIDPVAALQHAGMAAGVVIVSAYPQQALQDQLTSIDYHAYLAKPVRQTALEQVIESLLS